MGGKPSTQLDNWGHGWPLHGTHWQSLATAASGRRLQAGVPSGSLFGLCGSSIFVEIVGGVLVFVY
jgi:hypothetical protein